MLEIKTVANRYAAEFDEGVNTALREGWELVRRECIIIDHTPVLYAELERTIGEEAELPVDFARWELSRDPHIPYRCSACGSKSKSPLATCPICSASMGGEEEYR